jgi:hypothetical protein
MHQRSRLSRQVAYWALCDLAALFAEAALSDRTELFSGRTDLHTQRDEFTYQVLACNTLC